MSIQSPPQMTLIQKLQLVYLAILASVIGISVIGSVGIFDVSAVQVLPPALLQIIPALAITLLAVGFFVRGALLKRAVNGGQQQILTAHIISLALTEGCAILGLLCSLLANDPAYSQYLGGAAVLTLIAAWPKR